MSMDLDETFSSIDLVSQCLTDERRTAKFQEAIERAVRPGDTVLDSGTGSGILALMAARAGAKKVVAVEYDPFVAKIAMQNVAQNGYADVVHIVLGDIRDSNFSEGTKFDVVIMEMLTTGMIDEFQVWAMNNLHAKGYVGPETRFVPQSQRTYLAPAYADFSNYGFNLRMVRHIWEPYASIDKKLLADSVLISSIPFDSIAPLESETKTEFTAVEDGIVNSVYLTSISVLHDEIEVGDTAALNAPVIFPLKEDLTVRKGDIIEISVNYRFGGGFRNFHADARIL